MCFRDLDILNLSIVVSCFRLEPGLNNDQAVRIKSGQKWHKKIRLNTFTKVKSKYLIYTVEAVRVLKLTIRTKVMD